MMFLIKDKIGPCSEIVYGRAGDPVKVMGAALGEMILVKGRKDLFYVYPNEISENPIHENKEVNPSPKIVEKGRGISKRKSTSKR
jgi:hypothetical protein